MHVLLSSQVLFGYEQKIEDEFSIGWLKQLSRVQFFIEAKKKFTHNNLVLGFK